MAEQQKGTSTRAKAQKAPDAADEPTEAPAAVAEAPEPEPSPVRIPVERLMCDSDAFTGYPAHILAGALCGDPRTELTPDKARVACEAWLGVK